MTVRAPEDVDRAESGGALGISSGVAASAMGMLRIPWPAVFVGDHSDEDFDR